MNMSNQRRGLNPATEQLIQTLRMTGYTEQAAEEIALALSTLANYNLLSLFGGGQLLGNLMNLNRLSLNGSAGSSSGNSSAPQAAVPSLLSANSSSRAGDGLLGSYTTSSGSSAHDDDTSSALLRQLTQSLSRTQASKSGDVFGPVGSSSSSSQNAGVTNSGITSLFGGDSLFSGSAYSTADNDNSFGLGPNSSSPEPSDTQEVEVAENLAGAIIGQGGRGISELHSMTGASVSVSKRGVFAPGTNNRIVTVTGPVSSVRRATDLVRQRIAEAEQRRSGGSNSF